MGIKTAIEGLSDIWGYTAKTWSEKQAGKYHSMIKVTCENNQLS